MDTQTDLSHSWVHMQFARFDHQKVLCHTSLEAMKLRKISSFGCGYSSTFLSVGELRRVDDTARSPEVADSNKHPLLAPK